MRKKLFTGALLGLGISLNASADAPKVAVDIAPLHSLVSQVMAGVADPDLIIPAEASPHHYNLRPSQAKALAESEVVFWIGEELTPWLEKAMNNVAGSAQKVSMLELDSTTTHEFREGATFEGHAHHDEDDHHDEHGHHDEHDHHDEHGHHDGDDEHGHHDEHKDHHDDHHDGHGPGLFDKIASFFGGNDHHEDEHHDDHHDDHKDHDGHEEHGHEGVDPHAWLDPQNAKSWVNEIANVLAQKDPENAKAYAANAKAATAALEQLMANTKAEIQALGDLNFIVFHDAYQYFEKRFGISAKGSISLGDAEDPSPARIEEIRNTVQKLDVTCVFAEPQYDSGLVKNVFQGSNVTSIGIMDPLGASLTTGTTHYAELIQGMVASLGQCKP